MTYYINHYLVIYLGVARPFGSFGRAQLCYIWAARGDQGYPVQFSHGISLRHIGSDTCYYSSAPRITFIFTCISLP